MPVQRLPVDPQVAPGSTLRPAARFVVSEGAVELATATLGTAEVLERQPHEHLIARLSWVAGELAAARAVVNAAVAAVPVDRFVHLLTMLPASAEVLGARLALAEDCGFQLFQEKEGFWWADRGQPLPPPERISVHPMSEVGRDEFRSVMARSMAGSLDRSDRATLALRGTREWVEVFLRHHVTVADEPYWLIGRTSDGAVVGFVGLVVRSEDPPVGTIVHIGVVPERRGRRYSDELLRAAHRAARERGFRSLLSHVDVLNRPMIGAMERAGVRADAHPWHKWHLRRLGSGGQAPATSD